MIEVGVVDWCVIHDEQPRGFRTVDRFNGRQKPLVLGGAYIENSDNVARVLINDVHPHIIVYT